MITEKSAGAIIFRKEGKRLLFLLLRYPLDFQTPKIYWGLSKGRIEKGEKPEDTAKREVAEETELKDISFIKGFKEIIKYSFQRQGKEIIKSVVFLLAETKTAKIKLSSEHIGYKWLPYEEAIELLTFDNAKEILKKANNFLSRKGL